MIFKGIKNTIHHKVIKNMIMISLLEVKNLILNDYI